MTFAPDITVVILMYNECATLRAVVQEMASELNRLSLSGDILIVDDGSTDGSGELSEQLAGEIAGVRVIRHETNRGLGGVYDTAFRNARGELLTFFPADGQFPASILADFAARIRDHDMVLGYLPERRQSVVDWLLARTERLLYRALLGPIPRFQGIVMFRRALLDTITLHSSGRGWAVLMEFIIKAARRPACRVASVPTTIRPRTSGRSKVRNVRTIVANLQQIVKLRANL